MKRKSFLALLLLFTFLCGTIPASASVPVLPNNRYIRTYPLSTKNNTYVYTTSALNQRGTLNPYQAYNATIYASDEVYVYSINGTSAYISYPTSSGRRYGYVKTSDLTALNQNLANTVTSRAKVNTYKRPNGDTYGSISKGDVVYIVGTSGNYTQVIYPVGTNYKMGFIKTSDYNTYLASGYQPEGCVDSIVSNGKGQITLRGWAFDRDSMGTALTLHVYVGGPAGSPNASGYVITANTYRPDVHNVFQTGSYHGFDCTINVNKFGNQEVYVYAINAGAGSTNPMIGTRTVAIQGESATTNADTWVYPMTNTYVCGNNWNTYSYSSSRPNRPYHVGIDIASKNGDSTVYATADGVVEKTGYNSANGYFVILRHTIDSKIVYSFYAHLSAIKVTEGTSVVKGTPIATFGNTGSSSRGAHLHFAIVDQVNEKGGYYGYIPSFSGDKVTYSGTTYYNPHYVVQHNKLP